MGRAWCFLLLLSAGCGDDAQPMSNCAPGTSSVDGICVPDVNTCGLGTVLVGNSCVAIDAAPDAHWIDAAVDALPACGPGTHQIGDECLPNTSMPGFEIRVAQDPIVADGYDKVAVLAIGPEIDGGASM